MSNCNCNYGPCVDQPPPIITEEAVSSQLHNLVTALFGTLQKTIVNGRVIWTTPCGTSFESPANPRQEGEGLLCYLLRLYGVTMVTPVEAPTSPTDFSMFDGGVAPTTGFFQALDNLYIYTLKGGDTEWFLTPR
jgi:hypothetical protein